MGLAYQLDALVPSSLWADDAKTTPATDGSVVAAWSPHSSGSVTTDMLQTSNTKRPLYRANYNSSGYPAIEFDGTNDELQCAHSADFSASVYDIFLVVTPVAVSATSFYFGKVTTSGWSDGFSVTTVATNLYAGAPLWSNLLISGALAANAKTMITVRLKAGNRTNIVTRSDSSIFGGTTSAGGAVSTTSISPFTIGGSTAGGGYNANIAVHELRVYTGDVSPADRFSVQADLAAKWGLTAVSSSGGTANLINGGLVRGQVL